MLNILRPGDRSFCGCGWPERRCCGNGCGPHYGRHSASWLFLRPSRCSTCCRDCRASRTLHFLPCSRLRSLRRRLGACTQRGAAAGPTHPRHDAVSSRRAGCRTVRFRHSAIARAHRWMNMHGCCGRRTSGEWRQRCAGCASDGRLPAWRGAIRGASARFWRSCCCWPLSMPVPIGAIAHCGRFDRASPVPRRRWPAALNCG